MCYSYGSIMSRDLITRMNSMRKDIRTSMKRTWHHGVTLLPVSLVPALCQCVVADRNPGCIVVSQRADSQSGK